MHDDLSARGFEVLAFPCNQFGGQEPGTPEEIHKFATGKYNAKFPLFAKCEVNGTNPHPVYNYLRRHSELWDESSGTAQQIPWNFAKFLVDESGQVLKYYGPRTSPEEIRPEIENLL